MSCLSSITNPLFRPENFEIEPLERVQAQQWVRGMHRKGYDVYDLRYEIENYFRNVDPEIIDEVSSSGFSVKNKCLESLLQVVSSIIRFVKRIFVIIKCHFQKSAIRLMMTRYVVLEEMKERLSKEPELVRLRESPPPVELFDSVLFSERTAAEDGRRMPALESASPRASTPIREERYESKEEEKSPRASAVQAADPRRERRERWQRILGGLQIGHIYKGSQVKKIFFQATKICLDDPLDDALAKLTVNHMVPFDNVKGFKYLGNGRFELTLSSRFHTHVEENNDGSLLNQATFHLKEKITGTFHPEQARLSFESDSFVTKKKMRVRSLSYHFVGYLNSIQKTDNPERNVTVEVGMTSWFLRIGAVAYLSLFPKDYISYRGTQFFVQNPTEVVVGKLSGLRWQVGH